MMKRLVLLSFISCAWTALQGSNVATPEQAYFPSFNQVDELNSTNVSLDGNMTEQTLEEELRIEDFITSDDCLNVLSKLFEAERPHGQHLLEFIEDALDLCAQALFAKLDAGVSLTINERIKLIQEALSSFKENEKKAEDSIASTLETASALTGNKDISAENVKNHPLVQKINILLEEFGPKILESQLARYQALAAKEAALQN